MGMLDKLMFWKKDDFSDLGIGKDFDLGKDFDMGGDFGQKKPGSATSPTNPAAQNAFGQDLGMTEEFMETSPATGSSAQLNLNNIQGQQTQQGQGVPNYGHS